MPKAKICRVSKHLNIPLFLKFRMIYILFILSAETKKFYNANSLILILVPPWLLSSVKVFPFISLSQWNVQKFLHQISRYATKTHLFLSKKLGWGYMGLKKNNKKKKIWDFKKMSNTRFRITSIDFYTRAQSRMKKKGQKFFTLSRI